MKVMAAAGIVVVALALATGATASTVDPIQKVMAMIGDLQSKIIAEGNDAQKEYTEFAEFCEDRSRELGFEIKTGKAQVKDLKAAIEKEAADAEALTAKIEEISGSIATDEADLKAATTIREKENKLFVAEEKELMETVGTIERAVGILEKELAKGGASMMQMQNAKNVADALTVMVQASFLSMADSSRLSSLMQTNADSEDSDEATGAPAAQVYENKSGGIVQTLQDLLDKAETQLDEARKAETKSMNAYEMLAQSLKDAIKYATKDLDKAKKDKSACDERKAAAEGELASTEKDLAEDEKALEELHQDCMDKATAFESETKSRGEELKALATAKKVISETTSGAAEQSYSFLQIQRARLTSRTDLAKFEAVRLVRGLAKKHRSPALAQLAARMMEAVRHKSGADPFAKVKGLISDMIQKLTEEAEADATEKAYCDKEMAETEAKKVDKEAKIESLATKIDGAVAKSAKLKQEIATLQKELSALAKTQAEMDKLRSEEKSAFEVNSAEMEKGVKGVKLALKVLNEYYAKDDKAHDSADGAGSGIIGLLEVVEADFSKGLAEMVADEEAAAAEYDKVTKENEVEKMMKSQDAKYKTKEAKGLDKEVAELSSDKTTEEDELAAVLEYYDGIKKRCIAKPESYEDRKKRREDEIAGLKEALSILEGEAVLLQKAARHTLRGAMPHGRM